MNSNLCCVLDTQVSCADCQIVYCNTCWFLSEHVDKAQVNWWGVCPISKRSVRWSKREFNTRLGSLQCTGQVEHWIHYLTPGVVIKGD
jgi:hypothetical protein